MTAGLPDEDVDGAHAVPAAFDQRRPRARKSGVTTLACCALLFIELQESRCVPMLIA